MDQAALDLAIATAPRDRRDALAALFAFDARLAAIVRSTGEPLIGRMRLAWWREAAERLDRAPAPPEPVLADLARLVLKPGLAGAMLGGIATGWEALLAGPVDGDAMTSFATERGGGVFAAAAHILAAEVPPEAGEGWALADLARHVGDRTLAHAAGQRAASTLGAAFAGRFPARARPLGVLALLAAFALRGERPLRDSISLIGFRLTGRHRLEIERRGDSLIA